MRDPGAVSVRLVMAGLWRSGRLGLSLPLRGSGQGSAAVAPGSGRGSADATEGPPAWSAQWLDPLPRRSLPDPGGDRSLVQEVAQAHPGFVSLESLGEMGRSTPVDAGVGDRAPGELDQRPGFWLDAGTHAAEWTGRSAIFSTSR